MDRAKARLISAVTLVGLAVLLLGGVAWAWAAVTHPFPSAEDRPECQTVTLAEGDKLRPAQTVVSVLNASNREGLAGFTLQQLDDRGFAGGSTDNAPDDVVIGTVKIWATDIDSPAVALVKSYLGEDVRVIERDSGDPGVTVVVGNGFAGVIDGDRTVTADADTSVCGPPPEEG